MFGSRRKSGMSRRAALLKATNKGRIGQRIHVPVGDQLKEKKQNVDNWSNEFLLRSAMKEALAWRERCARGLEL